MSRIVVSDLSVMWLILPKFFILHIIKFLLNVVLIFLNILTKFAEQHYRCTHLKNNKSVVSTKQINFRVNCNTNRNFDLKNKIHNSRKNLGKKHFTVFLLSILNLITVFYSFSSVCQSKN